MGAGWFRHLSATPAPGGDPKTSTNLLRRVLPVLAEDGKVKTHSAVQARSEVYAYMCAYVYMYTYICVYTYIYMHTYIYIHMYMFY